MCTYPWEVRGSWSSGEDIGQTLDDEQHWSGASNEFSECLNEKLQEWAELGTQHTRQNSGYVFRDLLATFHFLQSLLIKLKVPTAR